jgi:4'-phosphopantetheinyl transferase
MARPDPVPASAAAPGGPGIPRWALLAHPPGTPAEPLARGWLAARLGVGPDAVRLRRDQRGRPRLGGGQAAFDCNWSHSGERLLVALGEGVQVGADLERLRPRPNALALARRFFTAGEAAWLARLPADAREAAFVRLWCAKEAVLKAHGHGLSFGLERLEFAPCDGGLVLAGCDPALGACTDWSLRTFEPEAGYVATVAWRAGPAGA